MFAYASFLEFGRSPDVRSERAWTFKNEIREVSVRKISHRNGKRDKRIFQSIVCRDARGVPGTRGENNARLARHDAAGRREDVVSHGKCHYGRIASCRPFGSSPCSCDGKPRGKPGKARRAGRRGGDKVSNTASGDGQRHYFQS